MQLMGMRGRQVQASRPLGFLAGGSEMAELIRQKDWSKTSLGPLSQWPNALKNAVSICLSSTFPATVMWGEELIYIYNDAYRAILGPAKHPQALGRTQHENFPEFRDLTEPMYERIFRTGKAEHQDDLPMVLYRSDSTEEAFVTSDNEPIRDFDGRVVGVFNPLLETTGAVIGARRLETLFALGQRLSQESVAQACRDAAGVLAKDRRDVPFALLYSVDDEERVASLQGVVGMQRGWPTEIHLDEQVVDDPWRLTCCVREQATQHIDLSQHEDIPTEPWGEAPTQALVLPVFSSSHRVVAGLVTGMSPRLQPGDQYRSFFALVARQLGTAIDAARADEEERRRAEMLGDLHRAKNTFLLTRDRTHLELPRGRRDDDAEHAVPQDRDDFLLLAAHELRTPLGALSLQQEILRKLDSGDAPGRSENIHKITALSIRQIDRLDRLVEQILDTSRFAMGRFQLERENTDLGALAAQVVARFEARASQANCELRVHAPDPVVGCWDRKHLDQVISNLLDNTLKYARGAPIDVHVATEGNNAIMRVVDRGPGISQSQERRIFDQFRRAVDRDNYGGLGLGLYLCDRIVREHGGFISVDSVHGRGSTFTVRLPMNAR